MKTHMLAPGARLPEDGKSEQTRCRTNKDGRVQVSGDIADVDCKRCQHIVKIGLEEGTKQILTDTDREQMEVVYYPGSRIHFGEDGVGIGPDEKTFCGRRARTSEDAISSSDKEEVTCRKCLARILPVLVGN